jgi:predicted RNA binding protein YcfA (HicA-like mRNA interferase family)
MPRLRVLSGRDVVRIFAAFDFRLVSTRGSHAKLARERPDRHRDVLTVPLHAALAPGTILAIYRQACRLVPETDLRPFFYTD